MNRGKQLSCIKRSPNCEQPCMSKFLIPQEPVLVLRLLAEQFSRADSKVITTLVPSWLVRTRLQPSNSCQSVSPKMSLASKVARVSLASSAVLLLNVACLL